MGANRDEPTRVWGLDKVGINQTARTFWNLPTPMLHEHVVQRHEGLVAHLGPIVARTGQHTGRSPNDKFIVEEPTSKENVWWGKINRPIADRHFSKILAQQCAYLRDKTVYVQDCYAGADARYRLPLRIITEYAWHSMFSRNLLIRELDANVLRNFQPQFTIIDTPRVTADPEIHGTNSESFILVHFGRKLVLIGGTSYAGEIKKSVFTILNYLLPLQQVLSMHCSANYGKDNNDAALFFGLSGTGKTTLSTAPDRRLIGDDEHGWSDSGVFNFEGGCYAKVIGIRAETEPEIYETTRKFGTVLENVSIDPATRRLDLDDASLTENTRAAYPITHIPGADPNGVAGHPRHVFFLTYDAFGVLPPIARLTPEQAMYHFLLGYTSKVAGTEKGVTEPQLVFSPCFGGPFLPLHPKVYARLLGEKIQKHEARCWLVNTGVTGGTYGVGHRIAMKTTRALISAALEGRLDNVATRVDPTFHLSALQECPEIHADVLDPRSSWSDAAAYDAKAAELGQRFATNHAQFQE
jgi:phosphoenolpyruvate carboxykinase (ATP)